MIYYASAPEMDHWFSINS